MHKAFAMHLVQCFNPETCNIEFRRGVDVHITEEDVARVLGMPIGDTPVPTECLESHIQKIEGDFNGGFKGIEILKLENVIKKGHTDGRFHRAYMLFTLGCLLCPTTKEVAGNRLFLGVVADDLETLKTYKWPVMPPFSGTLSKHFIELKDEESGSLLQHDSYESTFITQRMGNLRLSTAPLLPPS
ncbi:hypothetical protein RHGRI_011221 [Rhododendron griersonianum]|nr:hypothetical protein RHGRI_011221 [Rhododendron griersonianum]